MCWFFYGAASQCFSQVMKEMLSSYVVLGCGTSGEGREKFFLQRHPSASPPDFQTSSLLSFFAIYKLCFQKTVPIPLST